MVEEEVGAVAGVAVAVLADIRNQLSLRIYALASTKLPCLKMYGILNT